MDYKERLAIGPGEAESGSQAARAEVERLAVELEQVREDLIRAEATEKRLVEQAKNLDLIDSLTIDDWSGAHRQQALEIERAGLERQQLSARRRRAEDRLAAAELVWVESQADDDPPVDLAA